MVSDELGKPLHDRATRGETLSIEEFLEKAKQAKAR